MGSTANPVAASGLLSTEPPAGRNWGRTLVRLSVGGAAAVAMAMVLTNVAIYRAGAGRVFSAERTPPRSVAVVFGAGVRANGQPSTALTERMTTAVDLYRRGKVQHLLVTGDNSHRSYDEPTVMRRLALAAGVPAADVTLDYAGFDTADSCTRARRIFGVKDAILVTHSFHLDRALFLCRRAGLDAVGVAASDAGLPANMVRSLWVRERVAAPKAIFEGYVDRRPTYGGAFVGLVGSEHPANPDPLEPKSVSG